MWYLKEYHRITYTNLLTSGKLNGYLADIDEQSQDMFFRLVRILYLYALFLQMHIFEHFLTI